MGIFDISGRKAIVTGGGRGLGRAMAGALAGAGAEVVLIGSSGAVNFAAEEMAGAGAVAYPLQADLSKRGNLERVFAEALKKLNGRLDILVNNAGVTFREKAEDYPMEAWDRVLAVNLDATFVFCQLAGRIMLGQGRGRIINIASLLSFFGGFTVPAYAASKAGVAQLTKALSNEWAGRGVTVNAIAPGYMATEMTEALLKDPVRYKEISARIPAGRWGKPDDLKGIAIFLASDASEYVSGAVIPVDGGYSGW